MKIFDFIFPYRFYIAPIWPAVIAGGAALLGGAMSNKANARQAEIDRSAQIQMAKKGHRYQVADMRAAGLNPILSATGGTGAKASGGSSLGTQSDEITPAVQSALAARRQSEELKLIKEQTAKTEADKDLARQADKTNQFTQQNLHANTVKQMEESMTEVEKQRLLKVQQKREEAAAALTSATAKSAEVEAEMDTSDLGRKLKWTNRTTEAAEGTTSAVRSAINPFHGPARRSNRK